MIEIFEEKLLSQLISETSPVSFLLFLLLLSLAVTTKFGETELGKKIILKDYEDSLERDMRHRDREPHLDWNELSSTFKDVMKLINDRGDDVEKMKRFNLATQGVGNGDQFIFPTTDNQTIADYFQLVDPAYVEMDLLATKAQQNRGYASQALKFAIEFEAQVTDLLGTDSTVEIYLLNAMAHKLMAQHLTKNESKLDHVESALSNLQAALISLKSRFPDSWWNFDKDLKIISQMVDILKEFEVQRHLDEHFDEDEIVEAQYS